MKNVCIVCTILLLIAIPNWLPNDFYIFLRWVVSASSIILVWKLKGKNTKEKLPYILGVIAILFNPILPIYLNKPIWVLADLTTAFVFLYGYFNKNYWL